MARYISPKKEREIAQARQEEQRRQENAIYAEKLARVQAAEKAILETMRRNRGTYGFDEAIARTIKERTAKGELARGDFKTAMDRLEGRGIIKVVPSDGPADPGYTDWGKNATAEMKSGGGAPPNRGGGASDESSVGGGRSSGS